MLKKLLFGCFAFVVLSFLILHSPAWKLRDFDQIFYVTIAYDLDRHGVFSNGPFAAVDSTVERPEAGMFFGPAFPTLVLAAMKLDGRFAEAVRCSVEADRGRRDEATCEAYSFPMRLINACLLVIGLIAVGGRPRSFSSEDRHSSSLDYSRSPPSRIYENISSLTS
jgi:hypothetical protein